MQKFTTRVLVATVSTFIFCSGVHNVSAHSGGTDASGGHTCRTNCEQYGLVYGQYHYHNSSVKPATLKFNNQAAAQVQGRTNSKASSSGIDWSFIQKNSNGLSNPAYWNPLQQIYGEHYENMPNNQPLLTCEQIAMQHVNYLNEHLNRYGDKYELLDSWIYNSNCYADVNYVASDITARNIQNLSTGDMSDCNFAYRPTDPQAARITKFKEFMTCKEKLDQ